MRRTLRLLSVAALVAGCTTTGAGHGSSVEDGGGGGGSDGSLAANGDLATSADGGGHYVGGEIPQGTPEVGLEGGASIDPAVLSSSYGLFVSEDLTNGADVYHVVWTGKAGGNVVHHHFTGSLWTPGTVTMFTPGCNAMSCALEEGDYVSQPVQVQGGLRIDFDTDAADGFDGFEFKASQSIIYLDVLIDGQRMPGFIYYPAIGMGTKTAPADPCKIVTS